MPITDKTIRIKIVSPERVLFDDDINEAVIDTKVGQVTILPHHIPLLSILNAGEIILRKGNEEIPVVVSGGIFEVSRNGITVLADTAEHISELDVERAQKAVELAQKLIKEKKYDVNEYERLQQSLQKHQVRIRSFRKWKE